MTNQTCVRAVLRALAIFCVVTLPVDARAQLRVEVVASGFASPVNVVADPALPGVVYVVEQQGVVRVIRNGQVLDRPFLDLRSSVASGGERGLLGMAFPPDAAATGRVFFNFTNPDGHTVVARFTRTAADPLAVDPATRFDLRWSTGLRIIEQPFANHNGGHLAFGPDGYLYVALGDGGAANDPQNNAQNPGTLLGKLLRIDVSVPDSDANGFRIPADNPFLDGIPLTALPEVWSFGWRNPWRFSFDDVGAGATGAMFIGDVGQNAREEINFEPPGAGGRNYGWRIREGRIPTPGVPATTPAYGPLTDPIYDYTRNDGQSVTGGYIYRGTQLPQAYRGRYFFADFVSSRVWSLGLAVNPATGDVAAVDAIEHTAELGGPSAIANVSSFGRDLDGELYLVSYAGRILRLSAANAPPNAPRDVRAVVTGSTVLVTWNAPRDGAVPSQYRLEAGTSPGASDLGFAFSAGPDTSLFFANIPSGVYYARIRSVGAGGLSSPSEEITIVVGGSCRAAPPAPFGFAALVNGRDVRLVWALDATPDGPSSFVIEAGSAPGLANLAVISVDGSLREFSVSAPPGTYYVRLRARNACGTSGTSNEIVVSVF
jgi:glucose/arabinose dehydrogenase